MISELIAWYPREIKWLSTISSNQYYKNKFIKDAQHSVLVPRSQIRFMLLVLSEVFSVMSEGVKSACMSAEYWSRQVQSPLGSVCRKPNKRVD